MASLVASAESRAGVQCLRLSGDIEDAYHPCVALHSSCIPGCQLGCTYGLVLHWTCMLWLAACGTHGQYYHDSWLERSVACLCVYPSGCNRQGDTTHQTCGTARSDDPVSSLVPKHVPAMHGARTNARLGASLTVTGADVTGSAVTAGRLP